MDTVTVCISSTLSSPSDWLYSRHVLFVSYELEVHTAALPLPVSVSCRLRTPRTPLLFGHRVHAVGELLQDVFVLLFGAVEAALRGFSFLQRLSVLRRPAGCPHTARPRGQGGQPGRDNHMSAGWGAEPQERHDGRSDTLKLWRGRVVVVFFFFFEVYWPEVFVVFLFLRLLLRLLLLLLLWF